MENYEREINEIRIGFSKWFTYSILGIFLFYIILVFILKYFLSQPFALPFGFLVFGFIVAAYISFLISKTKFNFINIYRIILVSILFIITYMSLLLCNISKAIYLLYVPVILMIMLLSSFKKSVFFAVIILGFCFFIPNISSGLQLALSKDLYRHNPSSLYSQEYLVVVIASYFTFLILYFLIEFNKVKSKYGHLFNVLTIEKTEIRDLRETTIKAEIEELADQNIQNKLLYTKILHCFESEQPFRNPDFNVRILAELLDSNSTYVSRALNQIGDKKFNQLVNEYRIKQVLEDLKNDTHQKFTIEHIYTNAGFSQQSTFNRIFKEHTGSTPSEYIKNSQR